MTNFEIVFASLNLLLILVIGFFQIKINHRLTELEGVVAVNAEPNGDTIKIVNVGKVNLYLHKFEMFGNNHTFANARLIALNSWYWIPAPKIQEFPTAETEFKLYLTDESSKKYIFTGGICKADGSMWGYRLESKKWEI